MKRALLSSLSAGALALAAFPALADPADDTKVSEVVVTATRTPTPVQQVANSITVVSKADIEQQQLNDLPAALATVPGINAVRAGGPGEQTSVFVRGTNSNHVLVLIDGIDASDPSIPSGFDFGQTLLGDVSRIEVLRGPGSSLYGSQALGGVINIITTPPGGPSAASVSLEGGSFGTFNQRLAANGEVDRLGYAVDLEHYRSDDTPVTPTDLLPPGQKAIGDAYDNVTASGRFSAAVSDDLKLDLTVRYTRAILRFTGDNENLFPSVPNAQQSTQDRGELFTRAQARQSLFDGRMTGTLGVDYTQYRTHEQDPDEGFGVQPPEIFDGTRVGADWQGDITLAPQETLVLGLGDKDDRLQNAGVPAHDNDGWGFAELQAAPLPGLALAGSVRLDDYEREGDAPTWHAGATYTAAATGTKLNATAGTAFAAPTLSDLFVSFPAFDFFANPNLKPERSFGYDVGVEQPFGGDRYRVGITWYHNDIRDLIDATFDPVTFTSSLGNVDRAVTYGIESFASARINDRLDLRADYTWTIAKNADTGLELVRRPKDKASGTATWKATERLTLSATVLYVGSWIDSNRSFSIARLNAPSFTTANVAAEYRMTKDAVLFARVDNLFDRKYQDPVGFLQPGLGAFAGVRLRFAGL
ncbi:MAG TPA: TonB-dependent receptor [Caulobacteraceae bacterium]|jgi:vitamin B12 transporter